ncbi:MAG: hypothetical protein ACOX8S_04840 [Christensenellales bacterium]|jgi:hypothetical protein
MRIAKQFKDFVFRRCKRSTYGTLHLVSPNREPVTVTKEIRYSISRGASTVHIISYTDLVEFCNKSSYKATDGKKL